MFSISVYRLLSLGVSIALIMALVLSDALAENHQSNPTVSVTDYDVPISAANRLLIDFSMNHATDGSDATTSKGNIGGVYKRFYDSLPFGYSIDFLGSGMVDKDIEKDEYETNYQIDGDARVKKYLFETNPLLRDTFGSIRASSNMQRQYDRPASAVTIGAGYGRFIEATALARAVRIEAFLIKEGELTTHLPKAAIIALSKIISRETEYKDKYGDTYKKEWYRDMEAVMQEGNLLKEGRLGAIGILRIEEVMEREEIANRFYGWDVTLGSKFDITTPYEDEDRPVANLDVSASYAVPIAWQWQISERVSVNTPFEDFASAYSFALSSDISYELSNRIDFRFRHLIRLDKLGDKDVEGTHSFGLSFIYYMENHINLVVTETIEKAPDKDATTNFTAVLNYRVF